MSNFFYLVGFASSLGEKNLPKLHKAAVIFTRNGGGAKKHGRSVVWDLNVDSGMHRFPDAGVLAIFGSNERAVSRLLNGSVAAGSRHVLYVTKTRPKKDGPAAASLARLGRAKIPVTNVIVKAKKQLTVALLGAGGSIEVVDRPKFPIEARPHSAPSTPKKTFTKAVHAAPNATTAFIPPQPKPAPASPAAPADSATNGTAEE